MEYRTCYNRGCTYNSGYGGYGPYGCRKNEHDWKTCWGKIDVIEQETTSRFDEIYAKLESCKFSALCIQDEDTRENIRDLISIIQELSEIIKEK